MASVTLGRLWLNPASDPAAGMGFRLASLVPAPQLAGEVRQYGNGRLRAVTSSTIAQQIPVTLRIDTRDEEAAIEAWQGVELYVRDPKGRGFFAVYFDPQVTERAGLDSATATLTLNEVSDTWAV